MAQFASIMAITGMGMQAIGQIQESKAKSATMDYNADVAAADAKLAEKAKTVELHKAKTRQRSLLARQNAVVAASGRDYSGSPLDVINRSEAEALLDQNIIALNANTAIGRLYGQVAIDRGSASAALHFGRSKAGFQLASSAMTFGVKAQDKADKLALSKKKGGE